LPRLLAPVSRFVAPPGVRGCDLTDHGLELAAPWSPRHTGGGFQYGLVGHQASCLHRTATYAPAATSALVALAAPSGQGRFPEGRIETPGKGPA